MIYRAVLWVVPVAAAALSLSCKPSLDDLTVWREEFPSRDLQFSAVARTVQNGGFGSGSCNTTVDLHRFGDSAGIPVLDLDCDAPVSKPYVLDNVANRGGTVGLTVHWVDATHLQIAFRGHPRINFLARQAAGIYISAANQT